MSGSRLLPSYPLHMLLLPNHAAVPDWWPDRPVTKPDAESVHDDEPEPAPARALLVQRGRN